jgi:hypothetical protein
MNPELSLSFVDVTFGEQHDAVRSGQADVGFVQAIEPVEGIDLLPVWSEPRVAIVPFNSGGP